MSDLVKNPKRGRKVVQTTYVPEYQRIGLEPSVVEDSKPLIPLAGRKVPKQIKVNSGQNEDWSSSFVEASVDNEPIKVSEMSPDDRKKEIRKQMEPEVSIESLIGENSTPDPEVLPEEDDDFNIEVDSFVLLLRNDLIAVGTLEEVKETIVSTLAKGYGFNDFMLLKRLGFSLDLKIKE